MFDPASLVGAVVYARQLVVDERVVLRAEHQAPYQTLRRQAPTLTQPLHRELIQRSERTFGSEHQRTLRARYDLASLYIVEGRFDEGERLARATMRTSRVWTTDAV